MKRQIIASTTVGDFQIPLSLVDRVSIQKSKQWYIWFKWQNSSSVTNRHKYNVPPKCCRIHIFSAACKAMSKTSYLSLLSCAVINTMTQCNLSIISSYNCQGIAHHRAKSRQGHEIESESQGMEEWCSVACFLVLTSITCSGVALLIMGWALSH